MASFDAGATARGQDQRHRDVPVAARRPQQGGHAELFGDHRCGGQMPVRRERSTVATDPPAHVWPANIAFDRGDRFRRQHRQVRQRLVAHCGPVAVGASQVGRRVLAALALLVHVRLVNSDYVNPALLTRHSQNNTRLQSIHEGDTLNILTTFLRQFRAVCPAQASDRARKPSQLRDSVETLFGENVYISSISGYRGRRAGTSGMTILPPQ